MKINRLRTAALSLSLAAALAIPAFAADALAAAPVVISPPPTIAVQETDIPEDPFVIAPQDSSVIAGNSTFSLQINGKDTGVIPCVMVPLRAVAEFLGFQVTWNNGSVLVDNGVIHTNVTIGKDLYIMSTSLEGSGRSSMPFSLGAAPYLSHGVTYVPVTLFQHLLGNSDNVITVDGGKIIINTQP